LVEFFASKKIDALLLIPGNFTPGPYYAIMAQALDLPTILWGMTTTGCLGGFRGLQQTFFPFKELGLTYITVIGDLGEERIWRKIIPMPAPQPSGSA